MSKLTRQDTMDLIVHYQRTGCNETAEQLIKENMNMIRTIVRKFSPILGVDDMMQQGMMGFYEGLKVFDVERGLALSTFMYRHVYSYVQRWARTFQTVRTNRTTLELHPKARSIIEAYYNEHGVHISSKELATLLGVPHWRASEVLQTMSHYTHSLDAPPLGADDGESSYMDVMPNTGTEISVDDIQLRLAISSLDERERAVIKMHYFDGYGQREIGEHLDLTQTAVSRILKKSHEKLRQLMQEN